MQVRRYAGIFLIMLIALAPLVAGCDVFETDDDADDAETPTEEAEETPEDGETPEVTEEPEETAPEGTPEEDGTPEDEEPAPAEETPTPEDEDAEPEEVGQEIFDTTCAACHQPEGEGIEGIYPALAGNPFVTADDPGAVINVVLTGRGGMPQFAGEYSNEEVAAIVTYIRNAWDNDASEVTAEDVEEARQALEEEAQEEEDDEEKESGGGQSEETEGDEDVDEGEDGEDDSEDDESN